MENGEWIRRALDVWRKKKKKKNASGGEEIKKEGDFTGKLA